jgi:hypothetical protein
MIDKYAHGKFNNIVELSEYKQVETYAILLQDIIKLTNCRKYLELGVNYGHSIYAIRDYVDKCVGVDVTDYIPDKNKIQFHLMTTDYFFKINIDFFDIIFIDANHDWIYVKRDFENSLKVLNEFGLIILHDTDPMHPVMLSPGYCSDSYHINDYVYANHPELDIITLPICDMGLTIIKRKKDRRVLKFI